MKTSGFWSYWS